MINLSLTEFFFSTILFLFAYMITHTISGCLQAYTTYLLGDPTAREEGFLDINPLVHIDPFGVFALLIFGIGWFQTVPIDPSSFRGRWAHARLFAAYSTEAVISICLAIGALFLCVCSFGLPLSDLLVYKIFTYRPLVSLFSSSGAHFDLAALFSEYKSPLSIVSAFLLVALVYLNIIVARSSIIYNGFRYMLVIGAEKGYGYMEYADYLPSWADYCVVLIYRSADPLLHRLMPAPRILIACLLASAAQLGADGAGARSSTAGTSRAGAPSWRPRPPKRTCPASAEQKGNYLEPIGFNRDPLGVFKVETVDGRPAIHVSGAGFGVSRPKRRSQFPPAPADQVG